MDTDVTSWRRSADESARTHAAVMLGDSTVDVLVNSVAGSSEGVVDIALSIEAGTVRCLGAVGSGDADVDGVERFPWAFVDDLEILVGSTAVPVETAFASIVDAAVRAVGVGLLDGVPVDLLEIACPSHWGEERRATLKRAVSALGREVAVVDIATAAVESAGERAPSFAVVVEVAELYSVVSSLTRRDVFDSAATYLRSGAWAAVGNRDGADLDSSVAERLSSAIAEHGSPRRIERGVREPVDVFVLDGAGGGVVPVLDTDRRCRVHRLSGLDVVRSMAAASGIVFRYDDNRVPTPAADAERAPEPMAYDDLGIEPGDERPSYRPPVSGRAAAWLDDAYVPPVAPRRTPSAALGIVCAAVALVVLGVFAFRVLTESPTQAASALSADTPASSGAVRVTEGTVPDGTAPDGTAPDGTAPDGTAPDPNIPTATDQQATSSSMSGPEVAVSTPPPTPSPQMSGASTTTSTAAPSSGVSEVRFESGRVGLSLPAGWVSRQEPGRTLLIPPDPPDRRIVVVTTDLAPGTTFDAVADDLAAHVEARGASSSIGNVERATDFGGRVGISYIERPGDGSVVLWRVFVEDDHQISLGCQSASETESRLADECAHAVSTLTVSPR